MQNILSVDVEDWFHILELDSSPNFEDWDRLESRVEENTHRLLDVFDAANATSTFFFLGWVGERLPGLVKETHERGHEVACHGYAHQLVHTQTAESFSQDIKRAKSILEDAIGDRVCGYRAPGFSITRETPWAFDCIAEAGYEYDASVFPGSHGHGGISGAQIGPHRIESRNGPLLEFPVSVVDLPFTRMCFFGGGYLRLFPYRMISAMSRIVSRTGRPVIYYLHPREIDPDHPRLVMSMKRRFKSYVNLKTTMPKLERLLANERLSSFRDWIEANEEPSLRAST
jgi:polysaccharide deacetylase family protein (PEP-CTERM system associated)